MLALEGSAGVAVSVCWEAGGWVSALTLRTGCGVSDKGMVDRGESRCHELTDPRSEPLIVIPLEVVNSVQLSQPLP